MKQNLNPESEWFGTRHVKAEEKASLVRDVFDSVADSYDVMNDAMSMGIHRLWKDRLIRMIRPRGGLNYLDVAGGTGDIAFRIRKAAGPDAQIAICDINPEMLRVGRNRAANKGWLNDFEWVTGDAEKLPVPDNSVDVYTIAFGLRNVTRIDNALADAYRVLKPGGRFFCLEFSRVEDPGLRAVYDRYSELFIPRMGQLIARDRDSYQYLIESIRKFPNQRDLARRMGIVGFRGVRFSNLSFGIAAIHQGYKA
ncbi:MAG: bifunctional demethylmenaquinone methyltransferase/2-methoxy-6-polyprenyl-1,4-benzoquinol methylase UbiE [Micavibrio aeruginosavorus]|uniref:Demethylmenaquinone methyltransferase n=1 Tax=Micavibrio aeruginosavorus TaxID=349221 RepID=A0A7T5R1D2_9BACT|nr:MAG: bifunctional demethylmenaquinone methyltransferase/2-methoxy-6-polyprenyl-1,4-benzoquinol methylase UbiE [Micavibrio aeruginosavorus]